MDLKRVVSGFIAVAMVVTMAGCSKKDKGDDSSGGKNTTVSSEEKAVRDAVEGLRTWDSNYVITNVLAAPGGTDYYLEVHTTDRGTYREYPVSDADAEVTAEQAADMSYGLFDWYTKDGKLYMVNLDYSAEDTSNSNYWVSVPEDYAKAVSERDVLFLDTLLKDATDWKAEGTSTINLGTGDVKVDVYDCTVPSDNVCKVLGVDTVELYKSLKKEAEKEKNTNVISLMEYYIDNLNRTLVSSDGKVQFGVYDGKVRYVQVEIGGLGTNLYLTKTVMEETDLSLRELPDFESSVGSYYDAIKVVADKAAQYDSYEEAFASMYSKDDNGKLSVDIIDGDGKVVTDEDMKNGAEIPSTDSNSESTESTAESTAETTETAEEESKESVETQAG